MSALRENAAPSLFEHLPAAIHIYRFEDVEVSARVSGEPRFVAANPAAERALGAGSEGALLGEAFPALRAAGIAELCARVAKSGESAALGQLWPAGAEAGAPLLRVKAFPLGEGRVGVMFEDVRELATAHAEEVRLLRMACQAAIDIVPDIVFVKSAGEQRYVLCNQAGANLHAVTPDDMIGKRNEDHFPPEVCAILAPIDARVMAGQESAFFDEVVEIPRKGMRNYLTTKRPIRDRDGTPLFLACCARDATEHKQAEEALARSRAELQETRSTLLETIRELSTPVLPIFDGILVVPLVGHMDSQRGGQLTEALLNGIQRHQAETVIIDITGVEIVDTAVASHLVQATRAASLLGTECVLVGIAPSIAQTLVQIGMDFGTLTTRRDLQAGVAYALAQRKAQLGRSGPS